MAGIQSFAPEASARPTVLVLGSIPGVASIAATQYYAHPRNAFWPIMAEFFEFDVTLDYRERLATLMSRGVALWDVLQRCERPGSLDSAIVKASIEVNPIGDWLQQHASVQLVLLNGGTAAREFKKNFPQLLHNERLTVSSMPSTSPAYAAMALKEKMQHWHHALHRVTEPR